MNRLLAQAQTANSVPDMPEERFAQLSAARTAVYRHEGNLVEAAKELGVSRSTVKRRFDAAVAAGVPLEQDILKSKETDAAHEITYYGTRFQTADDLIKHCKIDTAIWEIAEKTINTWPVGGKRNLGQRHTHLKGAGHRGADKESLQWQGEELWHMSLLQIKIKLRRKSDERQALESLIDDLRNERPIEVKRLKPPKGKPRARYALEIAICDPHLGGRFYFPESEHNWTTEQAGDFYLWSVEDLIDQALSMYGQFERIYWVFGNDFCHSDNIQHTTTAGTPQPESDTQQSVVTWAKRVAISAAKVMLQYAPVEAFQIPGNHDRYTSYMMGHILDAVFHQNADFSIDCQETSYKRFRFGANLIGMEHGHSIKPIRLAAVMANEWRDDWAETHYHEWHLGDQHRKGSGKPSWLEEQGCSVEFLPALVPPNAWHKVKSFSRQKRAATAFVWDYEGGQHRIQNHISKYTGHWFTDRYDKWLAKKRKERREIAA